MLEERQLRPQNLRRELTLGVCGKDHILIAAREKIVLGGWSLERTTPWLRGTCPASTPKLLWHEPVYMFQILGAFFFYTSPEPLLLRDVSLSPIDRHIYFVNIFLIIPFLISIKNV